MGPIRRQEASGLLSGLAANGVDRRKDLADGRSAPRRTILYYFLEVLGDPLRFREFGLEQTEEGVLEKAVGVQNGRRLRRRYDETGIGNKKEIQDVQAGAGSEIQKNILRVELLYTTDETLPLGLENVPETGNQNVSGDELKILVGGVNYQFTEVDTLVVEKMTDAQIAVFNTEIGVKVRAAEVEVHHDGSLSERSEHHAEIRGNERFSDAALAARDGQNLLVLAFEE